MLATEIDLSCKNQQIDPNIRGNNKSVGQKIYTKKFPVASHRSESFLESSSIAMGFQMHVALMYLQKTFSWLRFVNV